jgi:hypothetical protein
MNQWQPIATAPRDGTEFCAWSKRAGRQIVNWPPNCQIGRWDKITDKRWVGGSRRDAEGFTHWIPLPEPPEEGEGK